MRQRKLWEAEQAMGAMGRQSNPEQAMGAMGTHGRQSKQWEQAELKLKLWEAV